MNTDDMNRDHSGDAQHDKPWESPLPSAHDVNPDGSLVDHSGGVNPYARSQGYGAGQLPAPDARPSGVNAIAILMCVFGGIGVIGSLFGIVQTLLADVFSDMFSGGAGPAAQAQKEYLEGVQEITRSVMIPAIIVTIITLALSVCMIVGGVRLLKRRAAGLEFSRKVLLSLVGLIVCATALNVYTQIQIAPLTRQMMENIGGPGGTMPPGFGQMQFVFMIIAVVFAVAWALAKIILCVWAAGYLRREHVVAYFNPESPAVPSE